MRKLNQEQINELVRLRNEGKKVAELAKLFNVSKFTIVYWTCEYTRQNVKKINVKWFQGLTRENKTKLYQGRREYQRQYHRHRYNTDEEFKSKQIISSMEAKKLKAVV